jgi:hypothetical protein
MKEGEQKKYVFNILSKQKEFLLNMLTSRNIFSEDEKFNHVRAIQCWHIQFLADYEIYSKKLIKSKKKKSYKDDTDFI